MGSIVPISCPKRSCKLRNINLIMNNKVIAIIYKILRKEFNKKQAPIVDLIAAQTNDPFRILVATIISARTRDQTTAEVTRKLFASVADFSGLKRISRKKLEVLVFPAGFYKVKAKHLKQLPAIIEKNFNGKIPGNIEDLCTLPGVGRKTANLVLALAFNKPAICVDVHVHRISNRFGLLKTKTPFDTEMKLRTILPEKYWKTWNSHLVSFGQTVCTPVNPKCGFCPIYKYCKRVGV